MRIQLTALMMVAGFASAAMAQKGYTAPRTPDGHADLQGIWEIAKSPDKDLESSKLIVEPANHKIPYKPEALAQKKENAKTTVANDPLNKCYMPGVPRINLLSYPFQIFQTPDYIAIAYEYIHNYRTVYMKRDKHLPDIDFWQGDSIGHWEGDTLVVDVSDLNGQTWLDLSGDFHSDELKVTERYARTGPDTLQYEATIQDPKTFSRPWKIAMPLYRHTEKNAQLFEYECHVYLEEKPREDKGVKK